MRVTGAAKIAQQLESIRRDRIRGLGNGIKAGAIFLGYESALIVPVDTGALKASQYVRYFTIGNRHEGIVGYATDYAILVHEDLELRHGQVYNDWYWEEIAAGYKHARGPNQQAKYLEQPYRQKREEIFQIIVSYIK